MHIHTSDVVCLSVKVYRSERMVCRSNPRLTPRICPSWQKQHVITVEDVTEAVSALHGVALARMTTHTSMLLLLLLTLSDQGTLRL